MPEARHQVTIRRPASEVFAVHRGWPQRDRNGGPGSSTSPTSPGAGVGADYKQGVKGPGGRRIDADYRVTTYEPNSRLAFEAIAGPVSIRRVTTSSKRSTAGHA